MNALNHRGAVNQGGQSEAMRRAIGEFQNNDLRIHINSERRIAMRKLLLLAVILFVAGSVSAARARVFTGQIMDSPCAKMGSHDAGYKMTGTNTPKDCTLACAKSGAQFVLYNSARKITYKLDNQTEPKEFAGENVKVTGTYNASTKTIHVEKIEAAK